MRSILILSLPLVLFACERDGNGGDDTGGNNNGELPDILQDVTETTECANVEVSGCPFGAATSYIAGSYDLDNNDVLSGYEYWHWIPNDVLAAQSDDWEQGVACTLVWVFNGEVNRSPEDCTGCLYAIEGDASFSADLSDCPTDLENAEGSNQTGLVYKVYSGSGNNGISVRFPPSYNPDNAAEGTGTNSKIEWLSDPHCELVGAAECR